MSTRDVVLAFDAGTSSIKAVLVDFHASILASADAEYSLIIEENNRAEQIPTEYWEAACSASRQVLKKSGFGPESVAGIVFATQWKGMIPLDENGEVLHNSIIWLDTRAAKEAEKLSAITGKNIDVRDYWPRLMWYKDNHPDLFKKTACILEANGYLKYRACKELAIDKSNHFTRSSFSDTQEFFTSVIKGTDIDSDLFPPLVRSTDVVGNVSIEAALQLGVEPGIPVFGGLCDIPAVTIGSGAARAGSWHLYLGSSGWFGLTCNIHDKKPLVPLVVADDTCVIASGLQSVCMSYNWAIKTFYPEEFKNHDANLYALVESEIENIKPGSDGLLAIPSVYGEYGPSFSPDMRASLIGMTASHTRAHFIHAVLEGICFLLRIQKESIEKTRKVKLVSVNVIGGGTSNCQWMQMLANVMDAEIRIPANPRYAGAIGAACCALVGLGVFSDLSESSLKVSIDKTFLSEKTTVDQYNELFRSFKYYLQNLR